MRREQGTKAIKGIFFGILLGLIGIVVKAVLQSMGRLELMGMGAQDLALLGSLIFFAGWCLYVWGSWNYAIAKGYSIWLGLLLGLCCWIGLPVLFFLTDRHKESRPNASIPPKTIN